MKRVLLLIPILFMFCSCASFHAETKCRKQNHKSYFLATPSKVTVGSEMLTNQKYTICETVRKGEGWVGILNSPTGWAEDIPEAKLKTTFTSDSFKHELIYSGRSGNTIRIFYREYSGSTMEHFARPAFFQELQYDLSESTVIAFKHYRIEVLEATNEWIRFLVIQD